MAKTIQQRVRFDAPPERVYALYADARLHSAATGAPAKFVAKAGAEFHAHGPYIRGRLLLLEAGRRIVQTWRGGDWKPSVPDSVLVLNFTRAGKGTELYMVHANVPDEHAGHLTSGWRSAYWTPFRRYLKQHG